MPKDTLESIWRWVNHKLNFKIGKWDKNFKESQLVLKQYYFEIGIKIQIPIQIGIPTTSFVVFIVLLEMPFVKIK